MKGWMLNSAFALVLVMACGMVSGAFAESECATDADCSEGFSCQAVGGSGCAAPIGPDGEPLPDEPCVSETFYACVPPPPPQCDPAQLSADCPNNQVCVTYTYESCSGGGMSSSSGSDAMPVCPPEDPTCVPPEVECSSQAESYCVPRYFAPCEQAADCGPGFDCVEDVYEVCSGSSSGSSSGSEPLPPDEGTCETQSSGVNYCRLQEISCDDGAACPEGLVCETYETPSTSTCSIDENGNEVCTDPEPAPPSVSACVPEDWSGWFTASDMGGSSSGGSSGGGLENYGSAVGGATGQDGTVRDAEVARPEDGTSSGGSSSGGTSGTSGGGGTSGAGGNADGNSDDGGCQVTSTRGNNSTPWAALGLAVGLLLARLSRRRAA